MRDLWAGVKESAGAALDRVHPGVLILAGLTAVVVVFGALGLAMLADDDRSLDDLGLGAPPARAAEGEAGSDADGAGGSTGGGDSLSDGLTTQGPGGSGSRLVEPVAAGAPVGGATDAEAQSASGPSPGAARGATTQPPATGSTSTVAPDPEPTAPATTATTAPPTTSTTAPPSGSPGLIGGLLHVLGLG